MSWPTETAFHPTVVAEALAAVRNPTRLLLRPGPVTTPPAVVAAIAAAVAPVRANDPPPPWLRADQHTPYRRALSAVRRYGGALLALPVGSGKSYVALAVAQAVGQNPVTVVGPAAVVPQWVRLGRALGIPLVCTSHDAWSRAPRALAPHPLVIVDEAHRFRTPTIRRYRHLARALSGKRVLLVSATPVINRVTDLGHLLRLALRDDALLFGGLPSLLLTGAEAPAALQALGEVVITSRADVGPAVRHQVKRWSATPAFEAILEAIDCLAFAERSGARDLLRVAAWSAAASSPEALGEFLRAYRGLLLHAADAAHAGRRLPRTALRALLSAADPEQLIWWELVDGPEGPSLPVADLDRLTALLERMRVVETAECPKLDLLRSYLADGRSTIVFSTRRATVTALRRRLGTRAAWCTGGEAGIGPTRVPRDELLRWFGPEMTGNAPRPVPPVLVATDVASEGLDLQSAERVIHYDLPWTPLRLHQREGRARRLGSLHATVDVVTFHPPASLEQRLRQVAILDRKWTLPAAVGVAPDEEAPWEWRERLARDQHEVLSASGVAAVPEGPAGLLVAVRFGGSGRPPFTRVWVWDTAGWSEEPAKIQNALRRAMASPAGGALSSHRLAQSLARASAPAGGALREIVAESWGAKSAPEAAPLLARLVALARDAARTRDAGRLGRLTEAIRFVRRGHTAGEIERILALRALDDAALAGAHVPSGAPDPLTLPGAELVGFIVFGGYRDAR